jgi:hypothetical protein
MRGKIVAVAWQQSVITERLSREEQKSPHLHPVPLPLLIDYLMINQLQELFKLFPNGISHIDMYLNTKQTYHQNYNAVPQTTLLQSDSLCVQQDQGCLLCVHQQQGAPHRWQHTVLCAKVEAWNVDTGTYTSELWA